jgi:hypothetical protein
MDMPSWTQVERDILKTLRTPALVQGFLDSIPYSSDAFYRCPRRVMADRAAHCFDGALFAAAALRRLGFPPLLVDMRSVRDDDHIIAPFRVGGAWGAVAKSNYVGLRYREPVYRSLRELVMSYFEPYYNTEGERSLRAYSVPVDLARFDALEWTTESSGLDAIAERLDDARHFPILTPAMVRRLTQVDRRSYEAGMLGVNEAGLYRPGKE